MHSDPTTTVSAFPSRNYTIWCQKEQHRKVKDVPFNARMESRAINLRSLVEARGWSVKDLVQRLDRSPSFWGDRLHGRRQIGEKLARSIEEGLGLKKGWLDTDPDEPQEAGAAAHSQVQAGELSVHDAVHRIADQLEMLHDQARLDLLEQLRTLVFAPDSKRARAAVVKTLHDVDAAALQAKRQA